MSWANEPARRLTPVHRTACAMPGRASVRRCAGMVFRLAAMTGDACTAIRTTAACQSTDVVSRCSRSRCAVCGVGRPAATRMCSRVGTLTCGSRRAACGTRWAGCVRRARRRTLARLRKAATVRTPVCSTRHQISLPKDFLSAQAERWLCAEVTSHCVTFPSSLPMPPGTVHVAGTDRPVGRSSIGRTYDRHSADLSAVLRSPLEPARPRSARAMSYTSSKTIPRR
jgi:hypothetical protein